GHLAEIRIVGETRRERFRRRIRKMWLVQVHPAEVRLVFRALVYPPAGERNRVDRAALLLEERRPGLRINEAVVVHVEAAIETESRIERERADEGAGAIAVRFEQRRERGDRRGKAEARVGPDVLAARRPAR